MASLTDSSAAKRIAWAEKHIRSGRVWNLHPGRSDYQVLRRQSWLFLFIAISTGGALADLADEGAIGRSEPLWFSVFFPAALFAACLYAAYLAFKVNWALAAFDQCSPQSITDLRQRLGLAKPEEARPHSATD